MGMTLGECRKLASLRLSVHLSSVRGAEQTSLKELSLLFLKLGTVAFGGPAAHIAMMQNEVVTKRKWMTETEFLDALSASNLIPGPNSTELALHVGFSRRHWSGLLVAGLCFILPAAAIVWTLAYLYQMHGSLPQVAGILDGIRPIMIAIILHALLGLGKSAVKSIALAALGIAGLIAVFLGANELIVLFACGILALFLNHQVQARRFSSFFLIFCLTLFSVSQSLADEIKVLIPVDLTKMFLIFVKIGSVLYGSGFVLLAFLRADFVDRLHWINESQLMDAIAMGQVTPGPVFTTATFVGYLIGSHAGALLATIGIFLPAFFFVAVSAPFLSRLRASPRVRSFLDGVNVASLALMISVTWSLGKSSLHDFKTIAMAITAFVLLTVFKINSIWLLLFGAIFGLATAST